MLSAVPVPDRAVRRARIRLKGPLPDPVNRRIGCLLKTRCPRKVGPVCDTVEPPWRILDAGHEIRCHIPADALATGPSAMTPPIQPTIETHRLADVERA